jgi:hypothetical protein
MSKAQSGVCLILASMMLVIPACNPQEMDEPSEQMDPTAAWEAHAQETIEALTTPPTETKEPIPPTTTFTPMPTITSTPTVTATPTQPVLRLSVSENTHCRTGPGQTYVSLGVLFAGQVAEVIAQSTQEDYWYIHLPEKPDTPCWLSGYYATVEGDVGILPVYTPIPSPTPEVGFALYLNSFQSCGSTNYVVFSILNGGAQTLKSAKIEVIDWGTKKTLYKPTFQRFPFAQWVTPVCPPDHGNELFPGLIQYIHVPLSSMPQGGTAYGTVMLCTGDWLGGDCVTQEIWFNIP